MLDNEQMRDLHEAAEREAARREYPSDFPPLPEIPGGRYYDSSFYELEMEHVWKKTWLIAGHASEAPEIGSYFLFERLGLSIIITRDKNDEIKAFHNICRHRGAPLVLDNTGQTKRFTCPYHSWSFNLEGKLVAVPEEFNFACLDRAERGLIPVRCETWRGFIFINLDNDAGSLMDFLGPVPRLTADFPMEKLQVKRSLSVTVQCNWKALYDNFLESYHVASMHSTSLHPYLDSTRMLVSLFENGHARMKTKKKIIERFVHGTDAKGIMLVNDGAFKEFITGQVMFPNVQMGIEPIGFPLQTFWPSGPGQAIMDWKFLGWDEDGVEDTAYWDKAYSDSIKIVNEDLTILDKIQRSLEGGFFSGMLLSYTERTIYWYQEEIDRRIGQDNIPPALRVKQVLGDHVVD